MSYPLPAPGNHSAAKAWFQRNCPDGFVLNRVWRVENSSGSRWQVAYASTRLAPVAKNLIVCKRLFSSRFPTFKYLSIISNECEDHYWNVTFGAPKATIKDVIKTCFFRNSSKPEVTRSQDVIQPPTLTTGPQSDEYKLLVTDKTTKTKSLVALTEYDEDKHYPTRLIHAGVNATKRFTGRSTLTTSLWHRIRDNIHDGAKSVREDVRKYLQTRCRRIAFQPAMESDKSSFPPLPVKEEVKTIPSHSEVSKQQLATSSSLNEVKTVGPSVQKAKTYAAVAYQYDYTKHIVYAKLADAKNFAIVRRYIISCLGIRGYGKIYLDLRPEMLPIELANCVAALGLPLDESLRSFYVSYCKDRNLTSDAGGELIKYALDHRKMC